MLVNWFTVIAQIINFLVLVFLLKHFLFGRIIRAIDNREEMIASRMDEAEHKKREAENEAETYRKINQEFEDKRKEMLSHVKDEIDVWKKDLMEQARSEVDQIKFKWEENIQREKNTFIDNLRKQVSMQTYAVVRRALKDLANMELEDHLIEIFIKNIKDMDKNVWKSLAQSLEQSNNNVIILRSTFDIPVEMRQKIDEVVRDRIGNGVRIHFETSPDMICGIEMKLDSYKIGWNMENYLENLERNISHIFEDIRVENQENKRDEAPDQEGAKKPNNLNSDENKNEKGLQQA